MNPVRALSSLFFKLDIKSRDGSYRKLIMLFISFAIPGLLLPLVMVSRNTDPSGFQFTFISYIFYSFIIALTMINEFDNIVITQTEIDILSVMPVRTSDIVTAKLTVLIKYIFLISMPLIIPGAMLYRMLTQSVFYGFVFYIAGLSVLMMTVFILMLLYSAALKNIKVKFLNSAVLIFQILCVLALIIGYQYLTFVYTINWTDKPLAASIFNSEIFRQLIPQSWFAFIPTKGNFVINYKFLLKTVLPFVIVISAYYSLKLYLLDNYALIKEKFIRTGSINTSAVSEKKDKSLLDLATELYVNKRNESTLFHLTRSLYRRDRAVKMGILPLIVIPAGLGLFALLTGQLPDPFTAIQLKISPVFHVSILLAVLVAVNMSGLSLKTSVNHEAAWVYNVYPIGQKKQFMNGARKFIFIYVIIPVMFLLFFVFIIKIPLLNSVIHIFFLIAAANLYNTFFWMVTKHLPFSKENTLLNNINRISTMVFPFIAGFGLSYLLVYFYASIYHAIISIIALFVINYLTIAVFTHLRNS